MSETTDLVAETLEVILAVVQIPADERLLATLQLRLAAWFREDIAAQFGVSARSIDRYLRAVFLRFQKRRQEPVFREGLGAEFIAALIRQRIWRICQPLAHTPARRGPLSAWRTLLRSDCNSF